MLNASTNYAPDLLAYTARSTGPLAAAIRAHAADLTGPPWEDAEAATFAWAEAEVVDAIVLRHYGVNAELRTAARRLLEALGLSPVQHEVFRHRVLPSLHWA